MDLANGGCGRDLVYLLAWGTLMLVHNETICFENTMGVLGVKIDITDCDKEKVDAEDTPQSSRER